MEWQPIETAPKDGTVVLLYDDDESYYRCYPGLFNDGWWSFNVFGGEESVNPTHWIYLPPFPHSKIE